LQGFVIFWIPGSLAHQRGNRLIGKAREYGAIVERGSGEEEVPMTMSWKPKRLAKKDEVALDNKPRPLLHNHGEIVSTSKKDRTWNAKTTHVLIQTDNGNYSEVIKWLKHEFGVAEVLLNIPFVNEHWLLDAISRSSLPSPLNLRYHVDHYLQSIYNLPPFVLLDINFKDNSEFVKMKERICRHFSNPVPLHEAHILLEKSGDASVEDYLRKFWYPRDNPGLEMPAPVSESIFIVDLEWFHQLEAGHREPWRNFVLRERPWPLHELDRGAATLDQSEDPRGYAHSNMSERSDNSSSLGYRFGSRICSYYIVWRASGYLAPSDPHDQYDPNKRITFRRSHSSTSAENELEPPTYYALFLYGGYDAVFRCKSPDNGTTFDNFQLLYASDVFKDHRIVLELEVAGANDDHGFPLLQGRMEIGFNGNGSYIGDKALIFIAKAYDEDITFRATLSSEEKGRLECCRKDKGNNSSEAT
jgi:hypothetical protein